MSFILAVLSALLGLAAASAAVLLAWSVYVKRKEAKKEESNGYPAVLDVLLRWTYFDYILTILCITGGLLLLTNAIAVLRDADAYPPYHLPYLLSGTVFVLAANGMMAARLLLTLRMARAGELVPVMNKQDQPSHAD